MDITMQVHRVSTHPAEVSVEYQGETARAMLPELEVEMFHNTQHSSLTLRFRTQADIAMARDTFVAGQNVVLSFAKEAATKEPDAA